MKKIFKLFQVDNLKLKTVKTVKDFNVLSISPRLKSLCENKNIDGSRRLQPAITALFRNLKVATTDIFRILTQPLKSWVTIKEKISYNRFNGLQEQVFYSRILILLFTLIIIFLNSCTDKFDVGIFDDIEGDPNLGGDTVYVQLTPSWEGFNNPQDIYIGREPFIYIADTDNDRIVMMNLDGQILGTRTIKKPIELAQDYQLDLIVCAQFDTVIQGVTRTYSAVYSIDLVGANHDIENAPITRLLPRETDLNFPLREYTAVTTFFNNSFFVARKGPSNSSIFDPDNSILIFHPKSFYNNGEGDTLIGRVANIDPVSSGLLSANQISSLTAFSSNADLIVTLTGNNNFKAQWFHYQISAIDERYVSQFSSGEGTDFSVPNKFEMPEGSCLDNSGNIFIADAGKDSIYKFNSFGDELQSFGGSGLFSQPHAVTFFDRTLYVLDTGNNRILRFILSTDIQ